MSLAESVDIYCERTDASLLSEPINALSNAAFLIAAWLLWRLYRRGGGKDMEAAIMIGLIALVGLGSLSFHTFATKGTLLADIIPITLFIFWYLWVCLRRITGFRNLTAFFLIVAMVAVTNLLEAVPLAYSVNGSISYFPSLAVILAMAIFTKHKNLPQAGAFLLAFACFAISLTFRSIDMALCASFPLGTHFLWHGLNGVLLYLLGRIILQFPKTAAK